MNALLSSFDNLYEALESELSAEDVQYLQEFKRCLHGVFFVEEIDRYDPLHPLQSLAVPDDREGNRGRLWVYLTNALPGENYDPIVELMFDRPDSDSYMYTTRLLRSWERYARPADF
jgi:hypothetical protein